MLGAAVSVISVSDRGRAFGEGRAKSLPKKGYTESRRRVYWRRGERKRSWVGVVRGSGILGGGSGFYAVGGETELSYPLGGLGICPVRERTMLAVFSGQYRFHEMRR